MKRLLDIVGSAIGLLLFSPIILPVMFLVWRQDGHSPFYIAERVGKDGRPFRMVKLRSMIVNNTTVDSTAANDPRITPVGHFIRRYKLDEVSQLWNVLVGHMSLVGPRPNVKRETDLYTRVERTLLTVRPGITDLASIVFSDEAEILKGSRDPDLAYNQLIRPWKSRLGILYVDSRHSLLLDMKLIVLTILTIFSRSLALQGISGILANLGADPDVREVAMRRQQLLPHTPPGSDQIVVAR